MLKQLLTMIDQLLAGTIAGIEFGNPALPMSTLSVFQLRYIETSFGTKLCYKAVYRGQLGSGVYFDTPDAREDCAEYALQQIMRSSREEKITRRLLTARVKDMGLALFAIEANQPPLRSGGDLVVALEGALPI